MAVAVTDVGDRRVVPILRRLLLAEEGEEARVTVGVVETGIAAGAIKVVSIVLVLTDKGTIEVTLRYNCCRGEGVIYPAIAKGSIRVSYMLPTIVAAVAVVLVGLATVSIVIVDIESTAEVKLRSASIPPLLLLLPPLRTGL